MNKILKSIFQYVFNRLWDSLDTDGDGKLSQEELIELKSVVGNFYSRIKLFIKK